MPQQTSVNLFVSRNYIWLQVLDQHETSSFYLYTLSKSLELRPFNDI